MTGTIRIAQNPDADALLGRDHLALLIGALLDQQVPMEWAFTGPRTIADRLDTDSLDAAQIAGYDPDAFTSLMSAKPAVHRYPGAMGKRIQKLCQYIVDHYDGKPESIWDVDDGQQLLKRLKQLPGFGEQKSKVFVALLGKQYGVTPRGWRDAAGPYGERGCHLSVADVTGPESLQKVRDTKKDTKKTRS